MFKHARYHVKII